MEIMSWIFLVSVVSTEIYRFVSLKSFKKQVIALEEKTEKFEKISELFEQSFKELVDGLEERESKTAQFIADVEVFISDVEDLRDNVADIASLDQMFENQPSIVNLKKQIDFILGNTKVFKKELKNLKEE